MNKNGPLCLTLAQKFKCIVASDGCGSRLGCALGMGRAQRREGPSSLADQSEHAVLKNLHPRSSLGSMELCPWLFQWRIKGKISEGKRRVGWSREEARHKLPGVLSVGGRGLSPRTCCPRQQPAATRGLGAGQVWLV